MDSVVRVAWGLVADQALGRAVRAARVPVVDRAAWAAVRVAAAPASVGQAAAVPAVLDGQGGKGHLYHC